jgi:kumamolisin
MRRWVALSMIGAAALFGACLFPCSAQIVTGSTINGHELIVPESSLPHPDRISTNYFLVDSDQPLPQPPYFAETPASLACVYKLVSGPPGCPIATSTNVPTGGVGAIAIIDAGYYPTAQSDLDAFSTYFGIPKTQVHVVYANGTRPPVYSEWLTEEALDIEWAHAMAPKAKLFLVESTQWRTDPTWQAVRVASELVAKNGGGVVSMSWGDAEWAGEINYDHNFTTPGVVYFAASGDSGIGYTIHPGASPNVVAVGGTYFNRDNDGNFINEVYGGGGGGISPYEPRPSYQDIIEGIVGSHRGIPDVASDFCCAAVYLQGGWTAVAGTSWGTPTFAGIVNAAGLRKKSTHDELEMIYKEYGEPKVYKADFNDITLGDSLCVTGWDQCAGVGSPRTYKGK